ncbi:ABC transporter permease [Mobilicoccus caccae]|uniref:Peptide ABC transporter permease n=1 Tax=Mobilicoccus caccae TaxID=1859295 RepID=A0ABQ6IR77_9MICO|nr:ABC transporter permease [Mobilicoccus caccae]GMA39951.1 peptide ABC transporter permease [Mobilicoccus caccae]
MTDTPNKVTTDTLGHEPGEPATDETRAPDSTGPARSLTSDAWRQLRRKPTFWFSMILIAVFVLMAIFPGLFTNTNAREVFDVRMKPSAEHWFGTDGQGYDIYARTIEGARASILVGIFTTIATTLIGGAVGILAAYRGGWIDALVSRITDVFFAIPILLGGILFMSAFPSDQSTPYLLVIFKVVMALTILGWPSLARLMRGSVMQVLPQDYIQAARALGAGPWRIIVSHILPNAMAPILVVATINLGVYIVAEATLSFLGIGLVPPAVSWGVSINEGLTFLRTFPHIPFFPSVFLSLCVLAFIMLGDAARDAFDPKSR